MRRSRVLEESLLRSGMPYHIYGGQRFYARVEIKHVMAYLRLLMNRFDDAACERVMNIPPRGIGNKSIEIVRTFARDHGCGLWQAIESVIEQKLLPPRACTALISFTNLIQKIQEHTEHKTLEEMIDQTIKLSGLIGFFEKEKGEKAQARLENLEELVGAGREFVVDDGEENEALQQFIDNAALDSGDGQADEFEDSIQLMTLHSAKGLEFRHVYLVGLEENLFPHKMSFDDPERLEEERRLCYVGVTRAREKLFLSYAEMRRLHGKESDNRPSRFIREFPNDVLREVRLSASISRPVINNFHLRDDTLHDSGFQLGARVKHNKFGEGVLLNFEGKGDSTRVQVNFEDVGSKWLVLQYAKLIAV